ncbi:MAG: DUF2203 domain-containing protein [Gammaproteobacteria bacterium]|nr:DUF2203 domain-containing protein [Gammaproteobacteria bacterium]
MSDSHTQIGSCNSPRVFSLSEAQSLFPMVRKLTESAHAELEPLRLKLESMLPTNPALPRVEAEYETIVKRWVGKMERLGLVVKGLWLVDFDTGDGYLCWKFPELRLGHYHGYDDGFDGRRPVGEVIDELDPDWAHH